MMRCTTCNITLSEVNSPLDDRQQCHQCIDIDVAADCGPQPPRIEDTPEASWYRIYYDTRAVQNAGAVVEDLGVRWWSQSRYHPKDTWSKNRRYATLFTLADAHKALPEAKKTVVVRSDVHMIAVGKELS